MNTTVLHIQIAAVLCIQIAAVLCIQNAWKRTAVLCIQIAAVLCIQNAWKRATVRVHIAADKKTYVALTPVSLARLLQNTGYKVEQVILTSKNKATIIYDNLLPGVYYARVDYTHRNPLFYMALDTTKCGVSVVVPPVPILHRSDNTGDHYAYLSKLATSMVPESEIKTVNTIGAFREYLQQCCINYGIISDGSQKSWKTLPISKKFEETNADLNLFMAADKRPDEWCVFCDILSPGKKCESCR